jgi:hypothetical protein
MLSVGVVMSGLRSLLSAAVIAALIVPATPRAALALDGPTSRATWTITHQAGSPATGSRLAVGDTIRVGFTSSSDGLLPISCSFGVLLRAPGGGYAAMDFTVPATASGCSFEMVVPLPQGRWYQPDPTLYSFDVSAHASYADEIARPLLPTLAGGPSCATDLLCFVLVGGGARRTFTSTPELLSWNPFDWDPAYTRFAFGSPWSLRFPAWVSDCGGIELNGSWTTTMRIGSPDSCQEGITMTIPGIIPAGFPWDPVEDWELTASLRYARAGDGLWGGVSWMEATPIAPSDAPFASTAQAIFPIEIGVARFVTLGDRWAPSFHVSGFGPSIPEGTTCALEVVTIGWSFPGWPADDDRGYHVQSPVDSSGDCIFSIATPYTTVGQENQWNVSLIVPGESSSPEVFAATLTAAAPPVLPVIADPVAGATSDGVTGITLTTVPGSDAGLGIGSEVSPDPAPAAAPAVLSEPAGLAAYGTTCAASSISPKLALGSGGSLSTLTARCGLGSPCGAGRSR